MGRLPGGSQAGRSGENQAGPRRATEQDLLTGLPQGLLGCADHMQLLFSGHLPSSRKGGEEWARPGHVLSS